MRKLLLTLILTIFGGKEIFAQFLIEGEVIDDNSTPIPDVFISVIKDTLLLKGAVTNSSGRYKLEGLKRGNYTIQFNHVSFKDSIIQLKLTQNEQLNLRFKEDNRLSNVEISANKSIIERKTDRLRFNLTNSDLVIGSSLWEVINKTPFVSTTENGKIEIAGTQGAVVYINNRKKRLSGVVLMNYLKSIPSDNLEAIEVITTPSSRFEAEGGAGILNIIIKKNKQEGLVGNAGLSARKTRVFSEAGSVYLNYRESKWNFYSTTYLSNRERETSFEKDIFYAEDISNGIMTRFIDRENKTKALYSGASFGVDYEMGKNHVVGLLFEYTGSDDKQKREAQGIDSYMLSDSLTITDNNDNQRNHNYSINFNYEGKLGDGGEHLSVNVDFLKFSSDNNGMSKTNVLSQTNPANTLYTRDWFRNSAFQTVSNKTIKLDFTFPLNEKLTLETGVKFSLSENYNDVKFENRTIDYLSWENDPLRSNSFEYDENISAFYAVIDHELNSKWSYQIGSRFENTIATGRLEGNKVVDRNYLNVFPTSFVRFAPNKKESYVLSVSSRITRPSFWDVNPFREYTTDKTYFEGNPFLNPSKYYRQEFNYTQSYGKIRLTTQIGASQLFDEFYALPFNSEEGVIVNRKINYGNKYAYFMSSSLSTKLKPWWSMNSSSLLGHIQTKGSYAENDIGIDSKTLLFNVSMNQRFVLSKAKNLSLTVFAKNTFPVTIVNTEIGNRLETELVLRKSLGDLNISLSARDIFKSNKDRYNIRLGDINIKDTNYHDTQSVALALRYSFGKSTVKDQRYRDTGNSDIQRRL
ncbi:Outer membrane receptor proteins, mostly Fe transport [Tenacibaculum sp. MAR_2009_124]|uniref:outer membrane beta-barrel family protein n=1 Tax=Tenacibaculum sp. MAR_2009_124 TaxID=1250059 RepID=UPI0008951A3F|nr:outer membrane beta-barrel protein [Tenacibaculum sp. MAR_2009_124]SEB97491.1 Outer membrane receptor proteins, mostly Fe transport [Tenacibaculum sp. MAR_2009_124]